MTEYDDTMKQIADLEVAAGDQEYGSAKHRKITREVFKLKSRALSQMPRDHNGATT